MLLKEIISDYQENIEEIDKWVSLKGEIKLVEYADILVKNNIKPTWSKVDDLLRYDKRLLNNLYKYFSAFEDYMRSVIWNNTDKKFEDVNEMFIKDEVEQLYKMKDKINIDSLDIDYIYENKDVLRELRNAVGHSKTLSNKSYDNKPLIKAINIFKNSIQESYRQGFIKDINNCGKTLNLDSKFIVKI